MPDNRHEIAETVFQRNERREAEINDALKQEYARREGARRGGVQPVREMVPIFQLKLRSPFSV
jgi:hypothetical protein